MIDLADTLAKLYEYFRTRKEVVAVYLFGSFATGEQHKKSDIDLALLLREDGGKSDVGIYDIELQQIIKGVEVDVRILNGSSLFFQFQVLKKGKKIYCADEIARIRYEVRVMSEYQDFKYYIDYYNKCMYRHIKEGYLGFRQGWHK